MGDLDDRFRDLDSAKAPQLWAGIRDRRPGELPGRPGSPAKAALVAIVAIVVSIGAIAALAVSLSGSGPGPGPTTAAASGPTPSGSASPSLTIPITPVANPQSVSGLSDDGTLRCTATVPRTEVEPGQPLEVDFAIENLGQEPFRFSRWVLEGGLITVLAHPDFGAPTVVWDERQDSPLRGSSVPAPVPTNLPPGESATTHTSAVRVRWNGPLQVTPVCDYGVGALDPVTVNVVTPGPAPSPDEAVARVVQSLAPVFDACAPGPDGQPVTGELRPPSGNAPPMNARCSATVQELDGFALVTLQFVAPSDAPDVEFPDSGFASLPGTGPIEAGAWTFAVTSDAARAVDPSHTAGRTVGGDRMAPDWDLDENGRWEGPGGSRCGGESFGGGPFIEFGSVCTQLEPTPPPVSPLASDSASPAGTGSRLENSAMLTVPATATAKG
jgi:hypothetical protein